MMCLDGIGCFEGTFSLQLKPDQANLTKTPLRPMTYALQKPFQDEFRKATKLDIIALLGVNGTSNWCNSFVLVPKTNGKVRLCLDPAHS